MKKGVLSASSALCGFIAVVAVLFDVRVLSGKGYYLGFAIFNMVKRGTAMGFLGNLVGMILMAAGFGYMALAGFWIVIKKKPHKEALFIGAAMTVVAILSMIISIVSKTWTAGDLIITAIPAAYTLGVIAYADD